MGYFLKHGSRDVGGDRPASICLNCMDTIARLAVYEFLNDTKPEGDSWNPQAELRIDLSEVTVNLKGYPSKTYPFSKFGFKGCDES